MTHNTTDLAHYPRQAAEEIRAFNHATLPFHPRYDGIRYPGTAYRAIGALKTLAERLPQSFDQTSTALAELLTAGHLTADYATPTEHVAATRHALREAEQHATALAASLNQAHNASSPLGYQGPLDNTDDDLDL
ncbi:hypothetical protein AB0910_12415 [Streptomyces sp. NPDC047002]|uniref:hypothetical protein n=1 Tax=Streptomyces sp. NPDC047002 TaxID=3155475 RepID=UPI003451D0D4